MKVLFFSVSAVLLLSACSLLPREKVWIYYPSPGGSVGTEITVEGRAYDLDGVEDLYLEITPAGGGETGNIPLHRLASVYKGEVKEQLSKFRQKITFPSAGEYLLTAVMKDRKGNVLRSRRVNIHAVPGIADKSFVMFSSLHLIPLLVIIILMAAIVIIARQNSAFRKYIPYIIGAVLWTNEVVLHICDYSIGAWSVTNNLLLHLCGFGVVFCPIMIAHPDEKVRRALFPFMFYWGFGGALQALLTPDIGVFGFPSHRYFTTFVSHGLIIVSVVYMIAVEGYRVSMRDMLKVYGYSAVLMFVMYWVDTAIKFLPPYEPACYFFLVYPPVDGSAIDMLVNIFGPSPYYIIGLLLLGFVVFTLITLPFVIFRGKEKPSG